MKYFQSINEPSYNGSVEEYYKNKRDLVLETIKPICEVFGITDYDYVTKFDNNGNVSERLIIEGQAIGCACNSIYATVNELIGYIWVRSGACDKVCYFRTQTLNQVKKYWIQGGA